MSDKEEIQKWTEYFRTFGAYDPELWARGQVEDGSQYARYVFLRGAWQNVVEENRTSWIDGQIEYAERHPRDPGSGSGLALKRLLDAGASREDINEVVRVMQFELLESLMYQLDDPGSVDYPDEDMPQVNWALFEVDEEDEPLNVIGGLHESVLDVEPSGREMRPKGVTREG